MAFQLRPIDAKGLPTAHCKLATCALLATTLGVGSFTFTSCSNGGGVGTPGKGDSLNQQKTEPSDSHQDATDSAR